MKRVKELIVHPRTLLLSLVIALLLSLCGNLVFPELYKAGAGQAVTIRPLLGAFTVAVAYFLSIVFFAFLFAGISTKEKRVSIYLKGFLILLLIEFVAILAMSAFYGLIAVLIQAVSEDALTAEQIKGIINIATNFLRLLILPVFIHIPLVFAMVERKVKASISKGLESLKSYYLKILFVVALFFAIGRLAELPFRYLPPSVPIEIGKTALFTLIGSLGILCAVAVYPKESVDRTGGSPG